MTKVCKFLLFKKGESHDSFGVVTRRQAREIIKKSNNKKKRRLLQVPFENSI
jgi:hypothetical protein